MFIHEHPEFGDLLSVAKEAYGLPEALVEKDYWITHTLWALENAGLEVWFKGGTSLSKGFGIILRFSEDLDLKIGPGTSGLPMVSRWKSDGKAAVNEREVFFDALANLPLRGLSQRLDRGSLGEAAKGARIMVDYPGAHLGKLPSMISPHVMLEIGDARVHPSLVRPISSWVHDYLESTGKAGEFVINRPLGVNCIHPLVTLVEKLDAISRRFPKETMEATAFVRHYEDAAHIIRGMGALPALEDFDCIEALILEMRDQKQIRKVPEISDPSFNPSDSHRWNEIRNAHESIQPLFWGARLSYEEAARDIRTFLSGLKLGLETAPDA